MSKFHENPSKYMDLVTNVKVCEQTDGWKDGRMDRQRDRIHHSIDRICNPSETE